MSLIKIQSKNIFVETQNITYIEENPSDMCINLEEYNAQQKLFDSIPAKIWGDGWYYEIKFCFITNENSFEQMHSMSLAESKHNIEYEEKIKKIILNEVLKYLQMDETDIIKKKYAKSYIIHFVNNLEIEILYTDMIDLGLSIDEPEIEEINYTNIFENFE